MIKRLLSSLLFWLTLLQLFLVCLVFRQILFQPSNFYTNNQWDGIRSMFTIQTYVEQEGPNGWERFNYMNYPYGEEMVFAGGTPLFSYLLRILHQADILPSNWVLPVYYWMILISIPITALLVYLVIVSLLKNKWLAFLLAMTLPWINYQFPRLQVGHFDLSMTCFLLIDLWLLIQITKRWNEFKKQLPLWSIYIFMLIFLAYIHLYLAAIIAVFTSVFCFVFAWLNYSKIKGWKSNLTSTLSGGFFSGIAFSLIILLFTLTDPQAKERKPIPEGYNWVEWNAQFSSMFTPKYGEIIKFPLQSTSWISYENDTYLGGFVLYGILVLFIAWLFRKQLTLTFPSWSQLTISFEGKVLIAFFLSALCSLFIAFGEEFYLIKGEYVLKNYLNLFLWIKPIYPQLQQFRVLARFNFFFFWAANLLVAYLLLKVLWHSTWGKSVIMTLLLLSYIDLYSRIKFTRKNIRVDNFVTTEKDKIPNLNYSQFQAILPIPYYHVGSEDYNITIDPEDNWCTFTYYLSYHSRLPLMASKMPRTSLIQTRALFSLFMDDPDKNLLTKLKEQGKPVLLVYNPALPRVPVSPADRQPANTINESFEKFLAREASHLKKEIIHNGLEYYRWEPEAE